MGNTFFTSDQHIGHEKVAGYRFGDVDLHDQVLARLWDERIKPDDIVYCLGDISNGSAKSQVRALEWFGNRPGRIRLILGNHDRPHPMHHASHYAAKREYIAAGVFEDVDIAGSVWVAGHACMLSHFPYETDHIKGPSRSMPWRLRDTGQILIHGHLHAPWKRAGREIHVGVDAWDYKPVSLQQVEKLVKDWAAERAWRSRMVQDYESQMRKIDRAFTGEKKKWPAYTPAAKAVRTRVYNPHTGLWAYTY